MEVGSVLMDLRIKGVMIDDVATFVANNTKLLGLYVGGK